MRLKLLMLMLTCFTFGITYAQPQNMGVCTDSATGCLNLTLNNSTVISGSQNPSDYTITYHVSQADATANSNAITNASSYCIAPGSQMIYLRKQANAGGAFEVFNFSIAVHTAFGNALHLDQMVQCDDDGDGFVTFNLLEGAYLVDDGVLSFYPTVADAHAQTNQITNPTAYVIAAGVNSNTTITVREHITGDCDALYPLPIIALPSCSVGHMCQTANSLCSSLGIPFSNTINIDEAQPFYYACLAETPNPVWFYIPISSAGNLHLKIEQDTSVNFSGNSLDADYIIFGPFTDPVTPCSNGTLMGNNIESCSNSVANIEYPQIQNVQPGQFYLMMVTNYSNQPGYIKVTEMPTSTAQIDCSGIRMTAFLDINANGVKDAGEQNFPLGEFHYEINNDGNVHHVTAPSGGHNIYDVNVSNSYDLSYSVNAAYAANYQVSVSSFSDVMITAGSGMAEYFFPVTVTQSYNDVAVALISPASPMPGFEYTNKLIYSNLGTDAVATGTVTFTKDPLLTVISVSEASATTTPTGFTYNFTDLMPYEIREITITMQVPTIPTVQLGQSLTSSSSILPLIGDANPVNNAFIISEKIIGSYDPNDKMESHGGQILITDFNTDDYLYYTIRFENTGTAPAINIRVTDVLDEGLDESTLEMVSSSHDYVLERMNNELTWRFTNILLPPTMQDPVGSHGYITFKIQPEPGFEVGDIIPNTAAIYFDFNPAIITNTFTTEFVSALSVAQHSNPSFFMWPNPTGGLLNIQVSENGHLTKLVLYDMVGKQVFVQDNLNSDITAVDLSALTPGLYFIEVTIDGQEKAFKKLLIK